MADNKVQRKTVAAAPRLTLRIVAVVVLVALVAAGAVAGWAEWRLRRDRGEGTATGAELDAAARSQALADAQRLEEIALAAARLAHDPELSPILESALGEGAAAEAPEAAEGDRPAASTALLEDTLDRLQLELVVAGPAERADALQALVRAGGPEQAARALAASELVERAVADGRAAGAWTFEDRLYLAAAERVERDFEVRGALAVADLVGRATALEARALSRAESVYLLPGPEGEPTAVASTLGRGGDEELTAALAGSGALTAALEEGSTTPLGVRLGGRSYRASVTPLEDPAGGPVAARVTLRASGGEAGFFRTVQAAALAGGLAALLLGLVAAPLAARGATAPLEEVEAGAEEARSGDLAGAARRPVPAPLAAFFADAAEKRALEAVVAEAARAGRVSAADRVAERRRGAVLVVEMPRYARSGPDDEPRDVAERLGRDLAKVRRAVTARGGRVEAALGHRALAFFDGECPAVRALGAAAKVLQALSDPESAFDEPVPPAVALATGEAVLGGPEGGRTVTGLPVQQAEGLLREASSGDLILSRGAYGEVEEALSAADLAVTPQRGLLTAQPVYLLGADRAARAAEALGAGDEGRGAELAALAPGAVLADRFGLVERLATGATSVVFLAQDRQSDSLAAVKALRRELVADLGALEDFESELRGVLRVVHPAVARVLDLGVSAGVPFVASELVDGPSLARVLAGHGSLPAPAALRLARGLSAGLGAIHAAGLAHGDLRPETVLLDPRGHARLIDLGVAPLLPPPGVDPEADAALGSPRYLGPERLAGGPPTAAADVFAAGALLAEAFTGRPVDGSSGSAVPDPTELPDGLAPVLARCLARNSAERFADGGELAEALAPVRADLVSASS